MKIYVSNSSQKIYARILVSDMNEATGKKKDGDLQSELEMPLWSVVSFDLCEASGLTYRAAAELLAQKEAAGVYGLCIITDEAAARMRS